MDDLTRPAFSVRDTAQAKLAKLHAEYDRLSCGSVTSSRAQARLSKLAKEIDRYEKAIDRCQILIEADLM
jgi:hypothetical protein